MHLTNKFRQQKKNFSGVTITFIQNSFITLYKLILLIRPIDATNNYEQFYKYTTELNIFSTLPVFKIGITIGLQPILF